MLNLDIRKALLNKENKIGYRKQLSSFLTNIDTRLSWLQKPNKYFPYMLGKESTFSGGDPGLIPGSGRSTGEGRDYPLQYSGLENSMDSIVVKRKQEWKIIYLRCTVNSG